MRLLRVFGPSGGSARRANDVFLLAEKVQAAPYIYLACGTSESLLGVNRLLDGLLTRRGLAHEYHESPGAHSWDSWNRVLPSMLIAVEQHLQTPD